MGKVVFFFLFLWGFNYAREPLEDHCGLKVKALSLQQLKALAPATAAWVNEARQHIPGITDGALTADFLPGNLETTMRHHLEAALADLGYRPHGNVRCRQIRPEGFLRSIGIQGIYFPFTGEGYVDASLHPIALPFTMAHEMSHGYGFTAEGTANFLALLACERSENPMIRYSGRSVFFQYLRSELRALDLGFYTTCVNGLPPGIANDRKAIIANAKAHASLIPGMAGTVNDFYLKTQGVEEGTKSYDRLVNLTVAWFGKRGWPKHIPELDFE